MTPVTMRVETAIVGAGFAGIGAALALRRAGHESFTILERADSVGGTWRDNTYPGVACDVPAHLYGLASHPHPDWSESFAPGGEIRDYLEGIVRDEGLGERMLLGTPLVRARWSGEVWELWTRTSSPAVSESAGAGTSDSIPVAPDAQPPASGTPDIIAEHLILGCGRLTEPKLPEIRGLESFSGPVFHSARWRHDVDLNDARIAVVGTGASAVQLVPELARRAEVTVFQRTPAWIVPRGNRRYATAERARWRHRPDVLLAVRDELYAEGEARYASRSGDAAAAAAAREQALAHLRTQVPDPALRADLTPEYAFGCKRVLLSDTFYPALASGSARLEASALAEVAGSTLVAASGAQYEADAIVLATGFEAARQPYAELVEGEHGQTLAEHWSDGFTSVASTLVPGFPNLFVLNGPNASLGHNSSVLMSEAQAEFVAALIGTDTIRVTAEAEAEYTREIAERAAGTPWVAGGCRNWYVDERSGRLTLLWPGTVDAFRKQLARVRSELRPAAADPEPAAASTRACTSTATGPGHAGADYARTREVEFWAAHDGFRTTYSPQPEGAA